MPGYTAIDAVARSEIADVGGRNGYDDLTPIWVKDDGSGGWAFTTLGTGRRVLSAGHTGGAKTLVLGYHVPHSVLFGQVAGELYFHLHAEFASQAAGNAVITCNFYAAPPNGAWAGPFPLVFTLTPSNHALATNHIFEMAVPAELVQYLNDPDSLINCNVVRDPSIEGDTYDAAVYFTTGDFHMRFDSRSTTAKDKGAGWVKS